MIGKSRGRGEEEEVVVGGREMGTFGKKVEGSKRRSRSAQPSHLLDSLVFFSSPK